MSEKWNHDPGNVEKKNLIIENFFVYILILNSFKFSLP